MSEIVHYCDEQGCTETKTTECRLPLEEEGDPREWYCWEHAKENGYCPCCGWYSAGTEYFDFNIGGAGLCYECTDMLRSEMGEDDEYDDDYDYDFDPYDGTDWTDEE